MKKLLLLLALVLPASAQITTVSGVIYMPNGLLYNGQITCTWPVPFTGGDGRLVPAGPNVSTQVKNGVLSIQLEANDTATPANTYYSCSWRPTGSSTISETWIVPYSASPVSLSSVRQSIAPTPPTFLGITSLNGLTTPTQLFARTNDTNVTLTIGSAISTHTFTMGWTGTLAGSRGGLGANASAFTGVLKMAGGVASVVSGSASDCVLVDGTSSSCGSGGGGNVNGGGSLTTANALTFVASSATLNQDTCLTRGTTIRLDIGCTGSGGTLRVYDQTASTGVTRIVARAGAGQSTTPLLDFYNNVGTEVGTMKDDGSFTALVLYAGVTNNLNGFGLTLGNSSLVNWSGVGIGRNAAGVAEVNSGTLGAYRDLKYRSDQITTNTEATCDSTVRGTRVFVAGSSGVADTVRLCTKDSSDTYAWRPSF